MTGRFHIWRKPMETINAFRKLLSIDVSKYIERKGQFDYLSWPYAVSQLRLADPEATWEVKRFNGLPFLETDLGFFVEVAVTVQGISLSQVHPVLDGRNRPIVSPTTFDINSSIQRCLVKAIALHGLGLNVYAGEDLPLEQEETNANVTPLAPQERPKPSGGAITPAQLRYIESLVDELGVDVHKLLDYFGFESLDSIPKSEASRVIGALESKRGGRAA
jgi:hypothetical protein